MIKQNSTFYNCDLPMTQLGGPDAWKKNESGRPNWRYEGDELSYYLGEASKKKLKIPKNICKKIVISKGFITDGGSFNNKLVPVIDATPTGCFFRAFLLHDAVARSKFCTFQESNIILDEALELLGMGWFPRNRVWLGLSLFGSPTEKKELILNAEKYVSIDTIEII